jgi:hypothetical protein
LLRVGSDWRISGGVGDRFMGSKDQAEIPAEEKIAIRRVVEIDIMESEEYNRSKRKTCL